MRCEVCCQGTSISSVPIVLQMNDKRHFVDFGLFFFFLIFPLGKPLGSVPLLSLGFEYVGSPFPPPFPSPPRQSDFLNEILMAKLEGFSYSGWRHSVSIGIMHLVAHELVAVRIWVCHMRTIHGFWRIIRIHLFSSYFHLLLYFFKVQV